jgi:hypothetical protein
MKEIGCFRDSEKGGNTPASCRYVTMVVRCRQVVPENAGMVRKWFMRGSIFLRIPP